MPFSVLLILVIIPAVIFKRKKRKVETIQDYASTAIELLTTGTPLQLPPHPPPHPPPHLPRQFPRQYPPQLPTHDNTSVISENSSINRNRIGTYETVGNVYDNIGTYETIEHTSSAARPSPRTDAPASKDKTSTKGASCVNNEGQNVDTAAASVSHSREIPKRSPPVHTNGAVDSEGAITTDLVLKKKPQHHGEGHYEQLGNVYDRIGTYETVEHTSSAACPTPRTDAPTQQESALKGITSEGASCVNDEGQNFNMGTTAASVSHSREVHKQSPPVHTSGAVSRNKGSKFTCSEHKKTPHDELRHYERLGNVYDRIGTYETIEHTSSAGHPSPRNDTPTQEDTASKDKTSTKGASCVYNEGQHVGTTAASVSHSKETPKQSPPVHASGAVDSEGAITAMVTDLVLKKKPQHHGEGHYEQLGNVYDRIGTYETVEHTSSAAYPTPRTDAPTQEESALKGITSEGASCVNDKGQNMVTTAASVSHSRETHKQSPPMHTSGAVSRSEGSKCTRSEHTKTPQLHDESRQYERLGNVYDKICTYETIGNVYDKIGTYETIEHTSSAARPSPGTDAPTQEETASKDITSEGASCVNDKGQNMVTTAASVSHSREIPKQSPPMHTSGAVSRSEGSKCTRSEHAKTPQLHDESRQYERLGNVYDKICTYETIGNVYDKIGTYETIEHTSSAARPSPRTDAPTQEETASKDITSEGASCVSDEGQNMGTTAASVSHSQVVPKQSPPVHTSGTVDSGGAKGTDVVPPRHHGESHYEQLGTYETVGDVYDRICTYETIGNVYDNSLVPKP